MPDDAGDVQALVVTARQLRWLIDGLKWQSEVAHQPMAPRAIRCEKYFNNMQMT